MDNIMGTHQPQVNVRQPFLPKVISAYTAIGSANLFQSGSVLDYSCNPPMPSNPDKHATAIPQYLPILTSIQASRHPWLHGSLIASS